MSDPMVTATLSMMDTAIKGRDFYENMYKKVMAENARLRQALHWCQIYMTDEEGRLRDSTGRRLTPPEAIQDALDYYLKCNAGSAKSSL